MSTAKAEKEGLALLQIVTYTSVLVLGTVIAIILLQILFYVMRDREIERKTAAPMEFAALRAEQLGALEGGPRWTDRENGKVALGLEAAVQAVIRRYGEGATAR